MTDDMCREVPRAPPISMGASWLGIAGAARFRRSPTPGGPRAYCATESRLIDCTHTYAGQPRSGRPHSTPSRTRDDFRSPTLSGWCRLWCPTAAKRPLRRSRHREFYTLLPKPLYLLVNVGDIALVMRLRLPQVTLRGLVDYAFRGGRISYSESGEDLLVQSALTKMGIRRPRYVDVGANNPYGGSNTALFYMAGCRGVNIEPNPVLFKAFVKYRKGDVNLNLGVLDNPGEEQFYVLASNGLSTFSREEAERRSNQHNIPILGCLRIKVVTLNDVFAQYAGHVPLQFLSVDAEGSDERILRAFDFHYWSPEVICCETLSFPPTVGAKKNHQLIEFIESQGYITYADTWVNTIFVQKSAWRSGCTST